MKRRLLALSLAMVGAFFAGCEDTSTNTPVTFIPAPPSNPMALSLSDTSVRLKWTPSPSESNTAFKGYLIKATSGSRTFVTDTIPAGQTIVDLLGLDANKIYTFTIVACTKDTVSSSISIEWAGAKRFRGIRAYETASTNGSGIRLSDGANLTIANGTQWDVCLDTRTDGGQDNWAFGSPQASTYTDTLGYFIRGAQAGQKAKDTWVFCDSTSQGPVPYFVVADSLEAVFESRALGTGKMQNVQIMLENLQNQNRSVVFYVKTAEGNFAKILLKAVGGSVLQGSAPNRYVEIDYSFQTAVNVPYALRQGIAPVDNPRIVKIGTRSQR